MRIVTKHREIRPTESRMKGLSGGPCMQVTLPHFFFHLVSDIKVMEMDPSRMELGAKDRLWHWKCPRHIG